MISAKISCGTGVRSGSYGASIAQQYAYKHPAERYTTYIITN